jgi:hypothetical protein
MQGRVSPSAMIERAGCEGLHDWEPLAWTEDSPVGSFHATSPLARGIKTGGEGEGRDASSIFLYKAGHSGFKFPTWQTNPLIPVMV